MPGVSVRSAHLSDNQKDIPYIERVEMFNEIGKLVVKGVPYSGIKRHIESSARWSKYLTPGNEATDFYNLRKQAVGYYFTPSVYVVEYQDMISLHVLYYEELYQMFEEIGYGKGMRDALFAKERLLGMHQETNTIEINQENLTILDGSPSVYNVATKLTESEQRELESLLKKAEI